MRCTPTFHGRPRHDHVLVKENPTGRQYFAQLLLVFVCQVEEIKHEMAYIYSLDAPTGTLHQRRDRDLGFHRLRCRLVRSSACRFIPLNTIIRGALIIKDYGTEGDYLVIDSVDTDMWRRIKKMRE